MQYTYAIPLAVPGLLPNLSFTVFTIGYTGLGWALLQHLVHYRFLLSSSIFTHYLLNDLAGEQQALFPVTKALLISTQKQHYFSYKTSLSESNLRKRQSPQSWSNRCMLLPWTPHQGPDKRGANNNLWVEALQQSSDQT